jgi:protein-S-isoprenylcysteine O-methyltransferase Ste14
MTQHDSTERGADVRFPPPLVFLGAILLGIGLDVAAPLPLPVDRWMGTLGGLALLVSGLGLGAAAHVHFRRTGQHPAPWKPAPELIIGGPYRFMRNPMYVGMSLIQIGLGLATNDLWLLLLTIPALAIVHFIAVVPEERYLTARFGAPYDAYVARVGRYL